MFCSLKLEFYEATALYYRCNIHHRKSTLPSDQDRTESQ